MGQEEKIIKAYWGLSLPLHPEWGSLRGSKGRGTRKRDLISREGKL